MITTLDLTDNLKPFIKVDLLCSMILDNYVTTLSRNLFTYDMKYILYNIEYFESFI